MTAMKNLAAEPCTEHHIFAGSQQSLSMVKPCLGHTTIRRRIIMLTIPRTLITLLLSISLFSGVLAQTRRANEQTLSPIVTATTSNGRVRYASLGEVNQSRLQVFSQAGTQVYDSEIRLGNLIDWRLVDQQGQHLADGSYLFLVTVKDFSGVLTQKYGTVLLESEHISLQQSGSDELPAAQAVALQDNKLSEAISPVDRIGAAALRVTAPDEGNIAIVNVPSARQKTTTSQPTPGGEPLPAINIGSTGTQDRVSKWLDNAGTLGDSTITETAGKVGLGTTSPTQALDVLNGRILARGNPTLNSTEDSAVEVQSTINSAATGVSSFKARNTFNGVGQAPVGMDLAPTFAPSSSIGNARGFRSAAFFAPPSGVTITDALGGTAVTVYSDVLGAVTNGTTFRIDVPVVVNALKPGKQYGLRILNQGILGTTDSYGLYVEPQTGSTNSYAAIFAGGNVGIGTNNPAVKLDVNGDLNVTGNAVIVGNIAAKYQDVAEWVQARQPMAPGTVVSLDSTRSNAVTPSRRAYDALIAGVVSAQPGLILGEAGAGKVMVAASGRVMVKVDASKYPIRIGDLLVASNRPGMAMRSRPLRVGGRLIHRPGTIIGKALEALPNGEGQILVLVSLQ
jgi:hypothetical protein